MNVHPLISTIVTSGLATLEELSTVYGVKDGYDLLEIVAVNGHNHRVSNRREE